MKKIFITGGAGFIGSNFIKYIFAQDNIDFIILNIDKLTYAGNLDNLKEISTKFEGEKYFFEKIDICETKKINKIFCKFQPDYVINFAAETHVDRAIDHPADFIQTNIMGTYVLLEETIKYYNKLFGNKKNSFRFLQISTDEVFGELGTTKKFTERSCYKPNSPYSASKAAADHLVRAWDKTYGLPVLTLYSSNNYGPYQFPEKLIPLVIINATSNKKIPIYGKGDNIRDWLYVRDNCEAIYKLMEHGKIGENYNIGGNTTMTNLSLVKNICTILDDLRPLAGGRSYTEQIAFVPDRPGHDFRYSLDTKKITKEVGWYPKTKFSEGLKNTIKWYLENIGWWQNLK